MCHMRRRIHVSYEEEDTFTHSQTDPYLSEGALVFVRAREGPGQDLPRVTPSPQTQTDTRTHKIHVHSIRTCMYMYIYAHKQYCLSVCVCVCLFLCLFSWVCHMRRRTHVSYEEEDTCAI